jgi:deoxyribonuclease V
VIAIVDVQYGERTARAGCVGLADWADATPALERTAEVEGIEPYVPGELYRRELPALLRVLDGVAATVVVVDGYVWAAPGAPGLGAHLHAALGVPVVGVAKNELPGAPAIEVVRGGSARPLFVSAVGLDPADAARHVAAMHGEHRLPAMIVRADHLARGL